MPRNLSVASPTVQGTRGGDVEPHEWGVSTRKGKKLFIHILSLSDESLFVPLKGMKVRSAVEYASRRKIAFSRVDGGVVLHLGEVPTAIDFVVELD